MRIVLVGAPNSGKTTLYNWLTGLNAKAVNYPGSTVDIGRGSLASHWGTSHLILDTPGIYGFQSGSEDEKVTRRVLGEEGNGELDLLLCVLDGTQLDRQLVLFEQLRAMGLSPVPVVTMTDLFHPQQKKYLREVLEKSYGRQFYFVDGRLGGGLKELTASFEMSHPQPVFRTLTWTDADFQRARQSAHELVESANRRRLPPQESSPMEGQKRLTAKLDRIFLHPVFAIPLLFAVMTLIFTSVFFFAQPMMDGIESLLGDLALVVGRILGPGEIGMFVTEGVIPGFAAFLVFVPQIAILFLALAFLESTGYLARSVVLVDQVFSKLGLTGRSLVPILVGFACAVPAMMATRTISSRRDRWITLAILPLMTCSARLPVFGLLLGFLMYGQSAFEKGLAMAGLYFLSLLLGGVAALILHRMLPVAELSPLAIELPLYRRPSVRLILRQTWNRVRAFIERAAPVIFTLSLLIWFLSRFPQKSTGGTELADSYLGMMGHWIEPLFAPMGADWRVGVGILSAFAAREVFVATLAMILRAPGGAEAAEDPASLLETLRATTWPDGSPLFTAASVSALLIFFVVALQCLSTVAVAVRESQSWRFAAGQLVVMNLAAYALAVLVYQTLSLF